MTEVRFYHLTSTELSRALPVLLKRTLGRGKRALVVTESAERAEALAELLWTYEEGSFLPHGTAADGRPEAQPIWIAPTDDNVNRADFLFLLDGAESGRIADFEVCALLFDGRDAQAVAGARQQWRRLKEEGHQMTYWQQDERGGWRQT